MFAKNDTKPCVIRQILLLQEFDLKIRDNKSSKNIVANHFSELEMGNQEDRACIQEMFPDEQLMRIEASVPWYANYVNYLACGVLPADLSYHQKKKFLHDVKFYLWDGPLLFKRCSAQIVRRCVPMEEVLSILTHCHASSCGGHFGPNRISVKVLHSRFYWPSIFKDNYAFVKTCDCCQRMGNILRRHELPLTNILEVEIFDVWRIDFIGPFRLGKCTFC